MVGETFSQHSSGDYDTGIEYSSCTGKIVRSKKKSTLGRKHILTFKSVSAKTQTKKKQKRHNMAKGDIDKEMIDQKYKKDYTTLVKSTNTKCQQGT